ncbi:MAG TPA: ABC transporter permease [Anaerolineae bacterium]|nr:ABC transporter permease [Anaerolineae bacterium]HQH38466.1 ABC transporter permease [Anaerolineae bacterium]
MRKLMVLACKEVLVTFRDVGALVMMLVTPLALTLVMMAAFGRGGSTPLSAIPVLLLNRDTGALGEALTDIFFSPSLGDLVAPTLVEDEAAARARVEADEVAALVIIPTDFSARVFPLATRAQALVGMDVTAFSPAMSLTPEQMAGLAQAFLESQAPAAPVSVEIYASPNWRISTLVVKAIVSQGLERLNIQIAGMTNIVSRLVAGTLQANSSAADAATTIGAVLAETVDQETGDGAADADLPIKLHITSTTGRGFSWLDYYASSMAVLFLMFTVTSGGRTLLAERQRGTLPRLLISPTSALTVLLGKMGGSVLTGILQMLILWGATTLIGAYWGNPGGVLVAIVSLVMCASGVGALISAWATTPGQAGAIGSAVTLIGAALSGSFFVRWNLPPWVQYLSLVTPNAWGIEILSRLQAGRALTALLPWLGGVLGLTLVYYAGALVGFRRQFR